MGEGVCGVLVSTVDAFQGGERDIIILSTVRTNATGFIDNDKYVPNPLIQIMQWLLSWRMVQVPLMIDHDKRVPCS